MGVITQPYELDEEALIANHAEDKSKNPDYTLDLDKYFVMKDGKLDTSKTYLPHMAAGLGLKVAMNENFVLSVDWAMALDKQDNAKWANFYIKMGYLF